MYLYSDILNKLPPQLFKRASSFSSHAVIKKYTYRHTKYIHTLNTVHFLAFLFISIYLYIITLQLNSLKH